MIWHFDSFSSHFNSITSSQKHWEDAPAERAKLLFTLIVKGSCLITVYLHIMLCDRKCIWDILHRNPPNPSLSIINAFRRFRRRGRGGGGGEVIPFFRKQYNFFVSKNIKIFKMFWGARIWNITRYIDKKRDDLGKYLKNLKNLQLPFFAGGGGGSSCLSLKSLIQNSQSINKKKY